MFSRHVLGPVVPSRAGPHVAGSSIFWPHVARAGRSCNFPGRVPLLAANGGPRWSQILLEYDQGGVGRSSPAGAEATSRNHTKRPAGSRPGRNGLSAGGSDEARRWCAGTSGNHTFPPQGVKQRSPFCQCVGISSPAGPPQPEDVTRYDTARDAAARTGCHQRSSPHCLHGA